MKKNRLDFMKMKQGKEPITMVTAYDFPSAVHAESAGVDMILVGDSLGMVVLGYDSTIPVTVEDMIHHTKAVKRGANRTFIVTDMPFMSYHISTSDTLRNAMRIMQEGGADCVKIEGADVTDKIKLLTNGGIPVIGHLGLTPQSVNVLGGYKVQGKDMEKAKELIEDAKRIQDAGAIALVLECVPQQLAELITAQLEIPIIGIGAGINTDGQVLVYHDLIGYQLGKVPKFVKQYSSVANIIVESLKEYVDDVKARAFPDESHSFNMKIDEKLSIYREVKK
ncbi:3-methyl-2-oxobutanoate hydroxymethyltransferase [Metabacillus malikii]|uniref:3-methyl-2-oxobutanoate hydroxymethyltransferase n=1 Tax=Metabacillus malikii TaxID=1504265 RepID=A0ABT9Z950_9BACI|nr:3-methyl-2-oxobutanoate hydroxymethyltransferase [Metabacillus malikii]MDQ0228782.1 3-methyl-2-oxobutanoate hydroxymethyltransferase [Metabacillus malikii]